MLDPKNMWMAMAAFALVLAGWKSLAPPPPDKDAGEPYAIILSGYGDLMRVEKITKAECIGSGDRLWLSHKDGNDCTTVIVPPALKDATATGQPKSAETAIVFIDGDVPLEDQSSAGETKMRRAYETLTQTLSEKFKIPVLVVARPGILGSSGTHNYGGRRDDSHVVDAALDDLKRRYGIKTLIMTGQSGGSRLIAQLLILGRRDIPCAVLGSGAYDVPRVSTNIFGDPGKRFMVPMREAEKISADPKRRLFLVGDPKDMVTAYDEQRAFAAKLTTLGHHAVLVETEARGDKHHGVSTQALLAASLCAQGKPDAEIIAAAGKRAGP